MAPKAKPKREFVDLPPALIQALGLVSARYGQIEHVLTLTLKRISDLSYDEAFLWVEETKNRGRTDRRKLVRQHFRDWAIGEFGEAEGKQRAKDFHILIDEWVDLAEQRDNVIHCAWTVEDGQSIGSRRGMLLEIDRQPFGVENVEHLADALTRFVMRLNDATSECSDPTTFSAASHFPS
jgi:hypothetical protein